MKKDTKKQFMKRTIKDSVFTNLFSDKKYLLQLYKVLHPEDTKVTEDDILNVTIKNVLTDSIYNDLGFVVGNRLLVLVEAQSTWTVNITVRALMYVAQTYDNYIREHNMNVYGSAKVKIPIPELYVIFTGERVSRPEYISLSKEFFNGQDCGIEVKVKVIYDGSFSEKTGERDIINQYIVFTKICNEQMALFGRTEKALKEILRICKDMNVLKEYLESREREVFNIMLGLLDDEEIMRIYFNSVEKEITERVEKEITERVEKETAERVERETAERVEKETAKRVEKETAERVERETAERVERETAERVEKETAERVEKETAKRVEKETAERVEKETAKRVKQAKEETIRNTVEICKDFSLSVEDTIQKLISKCKLSEEEAKTKVQEYWK